MGLTTAAVILIGLETGLGITRAAWETNSDETVVHQLRNLTDPDGRTIEIGADVTEALSESLLFHISSNRLTRADPNLLFRVRPNPDGETIHGYEGINAQGFRGRPIDPAEASAHRSILVLSDSCGFGWGIRKYRRTLFATLERQLEEEDPSYRVYNLSQPGYSTAQARVLYESWAPRIDPDVLVLYLGWNDLWPAGRWDDAEAMTRVRWMNGPVLRTLRQSHLYRFLATFVRPAQQQLQQASGEMAYRPRVEMPDSLENLSFMVDDAQRRGARVLLMVPPSLEEPIDLPGIDRISEFNAALRKTFAGKVETVEFREMGPQNLDVARLFQSDGYHPNGAGAKYMAQELRRQILMH